MSIFVKSFEIASKTLSSVFSLSSKRFYTNEDKLKIECFNPAYGNWNHIYNELLKHVPGTFKVARTTMAKENCFVMYFKHRGVKCKKSINVRFKVNFRQDVIDCLVFSNDELCICSVEALEEFKEAVRTSVVKDQPESPLYKKSFFSFSTLYF